MKEQRGYDDLKELQYSFVEKRKLANSIEVIQRKIEIYNANLEKQRKNRALVGQLRDIQEFLEWEDREEKEESRLQQSPSIIQPPETPSNQPSLPSTTPKIHQEYLPEPNNEVPNKIEYKNESFPQQEHIIYDIEGDGIVEETHKPMVDFFEEPAYVVKRDDEVRDIDHINRKRKVERLYGLKELVAEVKRFEQRNPDELTFAEDLKKLVDDQHHQIAKRHKVNIMHWTSKERHRYHLLQLAEKANHLSSRNHAKLMKTSKNHKLHFHPLATTTNRVLYRDHISTPNTTLSHQDYQQLAILQDFHDHLSEEQVKHFFYQMEQDTLAESVKNLGAALQEQYASFTISNRDLMSCSKRPTYIS